MGSFFPGPAEALRNCRWTKNQRQVPDVVPIGCVHQWTIEFARHLKRGGEVLLAIAFLSFGHYRPRRLEGKRVSITRIVGRCSDAALVDVKESDAGRKVQSLI